MVERRVSVADVPLRVLVSGETAAGDMEGSATAVADRFARLFARPHCANDARRVELSCELGSPAPVPTGRVIAFRHAAVEVSREAAGWLLVDGHAWARTTVDRIEAHVPATVPALRGFVETTLFIALALALRERGLFHLHGALVDDPRHGSALLVGASGSGKTTTTLGLQAHGARALADDAVFVDAEGWVHPVPRPFHVDARTAAAHGLVLEASLGKHDVERATAATGRIVRSLVALSPPSDPGSLAPLDAASALGALFEASAFIIVDEMTHVDTHTEALRRIVERARGFQLRPGPEWLVRPEEAAAALWRGVRSREDD